MDNLRSINICIVQYPGAYLSAVYGMKDILEYEDSDFGRRFFVSILSIGEFVCSDIKYDYAVFPPCRSADVTKNLSEAAFIEAIAQSLLHGCIPVSVCAGAFFLCASGIADGHRVVTHWNLAKNLQEKFPRVTVLRDSMLLDEGSYISAGGMTGYQDLSLYLIKKRVSENAAMRIASVFLINSGERSQLEYVIRDLDLSADESLGNAQRFIRENFRKAIGLADIAEHCGISPRTLLRRFRENGEFSPVEYLQETRIAHARKMLESSAFPVKGVAEDSGYQDLAAFTRAFGRLVGLTPAEYRKRHRSCPVPRE